ncbi:unnamed protein product [Strongylus vulgaris]|nr:unnamed protein product [Strongylus vulgaris]
MGYGDEPDYLYIENSLKAIAKERKIDFQRQLDWIGKVPLKKTEEESETTSSDNRKTGEDDDDSEDKKKRQKK